MLVTVDVVVNMRTSIMSPFSGDSVNVRVVPLTEYARVGTCKIPLTLTTQLAVVCAVDSVNTD